MWPFLQSVDGGCALHVHVQPGASRSELAGVHGDALKVRIASRPVEGAANAALMEFIAEMLGVSRREVRMLRGEKSRRKTLIVALPENRVEQALAKQPLMQSTKGMLGEHS